MIKKEKTGQDTGQVKTFKSGFIALSWCMENPMKEIEYKFNGWTVLERFNKDKKCFEWKRMMKDCVFREDMSNLIYIIDWRNIKVHLDENKRELDENLDENCSETAENKDISLDKLDEKSIIKEHNQEFVNAIKELKLFHDEIYEIISREFNGNTKYVNLLIKRAKKFIENVSLPKKSES